MSLDPSDPLDLHPATAAIAETADARRRLGALERRQADAASWDEAWHMVGAVGEPAFVNNWSNYGVPESPLRFYKDSALNIYIAGSIVRSAGAGATVFTLPLGYRPAWPYIGIPLQATSTWVSVYIDGTVQMDFGASNAVGYRLVIPAFRAA